jgi:RNA polymerase sigma-70 factor (ECF subfamily)
LPFETTDWSLIRRARDDDSSEARQAMSRLFETYWAPVYGFIRRSGHSAVNAEDLAQAYFARFYEKRYARDFRPEVGRFRTFLRASLSHFLANEWDREHALKRGGTSRPLSLDSATAEERYRLEPIDELTPEALFERQWVAALLASSLARLRREEDGAGRPARFDALKPFLLGEEGPRYAEVARDLDVTESALRVAVHRLRKRFRGVLREEIARTVEDPGDVDSEIRWLVAVVGGQGRRS